MNIQKAFSLGKTNTYLSVKLAAKRGSAPKDLSHVKFGTMFSDHMLEVDFQEGNWKAPVISPFHTLQLHPASCSLHYALQCFEGMKAFKTATGEVRLFRPELNMKRLQSSLQQLELPAINEDALLGLIKELVTIDKDWVPAQEGSSLYIRPTVIGNSEILGVAPAASAKLFVICSSVGPYFASGMKPVSLLAETDHVRAWVGGTGAYKLGANYAIAIGPQTRAQKRGFAQVLWLDRDQLTEVGTMNLFVVLKDAKTGQVKEIVTPGLTDGTILPGVTRASILDLCREWYPGRVSERSITMNEVRDAARSGTLGEVFGAGTAAIVSPIKEISYKGVSIKVPLTHKNGNAGEVASKAYDELTNIYYGKKPSPWSVFVCDSNTTV